KAASCIAGSSPAFLQIVLVLVLVRDFPSWSLAGTWAWSFRVRILKCDKSFADFGFSENLRVF
ncbi:MAG TPA: hypothetical protein VGD05_03310, partial [Pyrinomonadaceae bacterium]